MGRISTTLVAGFLCCLCLTATLEAQGEFSYEFEDVPENIQAETGTTVPFQVKLVLGSSGLDATGPQGWSLGVANNGVNITALTTAGSAAADVADGGLRNTGFEVFEIVDPDRNDGQQGLVQALVLSFVMPITLPPNTDQIIGFVDYEATVGAEASSATIQYQNGLVGSGQPVNNDVTFEGQTATPTLSAANINIEPPPPPETACDDGEDNDGDGAADCEDSDCADAVSCAGGIDLKIGTPDDPDASQIVLCASEGGGEALVTAYVGPNDPADPPANGAQGWSLGIEHNPAELTITNDTYPTTSGTVAGDVNDGGIRNTGFEKTEIVDPGRNDGRAGLVSAVVLSFTMPITLDPGRDQSILRARYVVADGAGGEGFSSEINFSNGLIGSGQPVDTVLTVQGQTLMPREISGITVVHSEDACAPPSAVFLRADANNDAKVDIADPIFTINWLIRNGPAPACAASADSNDDGKTDISDPLYTIAYRFMAGPVPAAPFPSCGEDSTPDGLACDNSSCP